MKNSDAFAAQDGIDYSMFFEHNDDMAWLRFIHTAQLWQVKNKYGPYYESLTTERKAA